MTPRVRTAVGVGAISAAGTVVAPVPALAHGLGGRQDLPVLVVSFVALAVLWTEPRWQTPLPPRPLTGGWSRAVRTGGAALGLAGLVLVVATGLLGIDNPSRNPAAVTVFVGFWLIVPFLSAVVGDIYPLIDPWRRLIRWIGLGTHTRTSSYTGAGHHLAVAAFLAFTFLELVAPDAGPRNLAIAAILYTGYLLLTADWAGRDMPAISYDGFAYYNHLLGAMGPIDFTADPPHWRGWLGGLTTVSERPGLVVMVVAMIGTVSYDASATVWWEETITKPIHTAFSEGYGLSRTIADIIARTFGLFGVTALIGAGYLLASGLAARLGGEGYTARGVATRFAHTLVPIAFAYAFAHYFTLIVFEGQYLISTISDPLGRGWDLFGTADRRIDFTLINPSAVWWIQVAAIVGGHVAGVVLAHDRALADFPKATAVKSQYAMLGLMVVLTGLGLVILSAG